MPIGRTTRLLTDTGRNNPFASDGGSRRIMVSIYYPSAKVDEALPLPVYPQLFEPGQAAALAFLRSNGVDPAYIASLQTDIYNDALLAEPNLTAASYPVVILSPAFGIERDMYSFAVRKLVRSGFVVLTVGATYESVFTVFPDGEKIAQLPSLTNLQLTDWQSWNSLLEVRVQDLTFVLNQLEVMNEQDALLRNRLNLQQVGIVGHSLGGAAVYHLLGRSPSVKAGVLLDPSLHMLGSVSKLLQIPVLLMRQNASTYEMLLSSGWSESLASETIAGQRQLADVLIGYQCFVRVHGANHLSFSDVPLFMADASIAQKHKLIGTAIADFMMEHVCGAAGQHTNRVQSYAGLSVIRSDGHSAS
ncbi:hypothetical protein [Paenibacillus sp. OV219]|uniref:alpha/beta hydrolase family protein n=1 Tax=Paenibacillus sp. OV219 TaxID=1884377 RepID=UPI0008AFEDB4|nr:hypothetical protein [Paenibacillus sp. OV219]SEO55797.1 Platelet-activating factor acetylhydrolase, isoform II [Paenibacillus sp. OV219]